MKNLLLKLLLLVIAFALTFTFVSCSDDSDDGTQNDGGSTGDGGDTGDTGNTGDVDPEKLVLISGNVATFRVVTSSEVSSTSIKDAAAFVENLRKIGVSIEDPIKDTKSAEVTDCEIIIGTGVRNRDEKYVLDAHDYGAEGYVIKVVDNKVLIGGGNRDMTDQAFDYFVNSVVKLTSKTKEMSELSLERSYQRLKETKYLIDSVTIAGNDLSDYSIVYDLGSHTLAEMSYISKFRQTLYDSTGYWLNMVSAEKQPETDRIIAIRLVEDAGPDGFRAYVDSDKNLIFESAYSNALDGAFEHVMEEKIIGTIGDAVIPASYSVSYPVSVVYYSQFGAAGDGVTDDFDAIYDAHVFANAGGQKVMGDVGATYFIHYFNRSIPVKTDVDFNGATFYIDDRGSEIHAVRGYSLFSVNRDYPAVVLTEQQIANDPDLANKSLKFGDTEIPWLAKYIEATSLVVLKNNHKDYIRHGGNINDGQLRQDTVIIEPDGKLHDDTPIIWDFEAGYQLLNNGRNLKMIYTPAFTSITIYRVDDKPITIENGYFNREACVVVADTGYKNVYQAYTRGIAISRANTTIKNLHHKLVSEPYLPTTGYGWNDDMTAISQSYPYGGFLIFGTTYNSRAIDCDLNAHTAYYEAKSTSATPIAMGSYDLNITGSSNIYIEGLTNGVDHRDSQYWGIMHSNKSKNLNFKDCVMNRFDAHEGFWNASFIDSEFGFAINVIGGGYLYIKNTTRCVGTNFISLRGDYGSTFNGTVELIDCTYQGLSNFRGGATDPRFEQPITGSTLCIFGGGFQGKYEGEYDASEAGTFPYLKWDFGYTCYHPQHVIIDNFNCLVANNNKVQVFRDVADACFVQPNDFISPSDYLNKTVINPDGSTRPMTEKDVYYNQYQLTQSLTFRNMKPLKVCNNESSILYEYVTARTTVINAPED